MSKQFNQEKIKEYYKKELAKMFSNEDIERNLGQNCIIKYSELADYNTINDLLPNDNDFKIILIESKMNTGHWCTVMKYKNIIEYFNSYGTVMGYDFKFISKFAMRMLGQSENLLTKLLLTKNKGQKIYYNKKKLQQNNDGVNTCGRHVVARVLAMKCGYELDEYIAKVEEKVEETKKPIDILVVDWIS
jgi:hypothetical protein